MKIISGGQTGADRAALKAALKFKIETGGTMPKGYKAHDGNHPHFKTLYNITESISPHYGPRTYANVHNSDATIRFAINFNSPGEICTLKAIQKAKKPHIDINILGTTTPQDLANWIKQNNFTTLNIAGNSEHTAPGIEEFVIAFLSETLTILGYKED